MLHVSTNRKLRETMSLWGKIKDHLFFFVIVISIIYFYIGVERLSKTIYNRILLKLRSRRLIPTFAWEYASKISSEQGLTISSILNNLLLHAILVISYECTRPIGKYLYGNQPKTAELHAIWIYKLETFLMGNTLLERRLQMAIGDSYNITLFFETIYMGGHYNLSIIVYYLSLFLASRKTRIYEMYMYTTWSSSFSACLIYALFPCAPPRLITEAGIQDTFSTILGRQICDAANDHDGWANCYAAMPSVHSIWCTVTCAMACYHAYFIFYKYNRIFAKAVFAFFLAYWIMMHIVIMASGHHWIADWFASWIIMSIYFVVYYKKFKIGQHQLIEHKYSSVPLTELQITTSAEKKNAS